MLFRQCISESTPRHQPIVTLLLPLIIYGHVLLDFNHEFIIDQDLALQSIIANDKVFLNFPIFQHVGDQQFDDIRTVFDLLKGLDGLLLVKFAEACNCESFLGGEVDFFFILRESILDQVSNIFYITFIKIAVHAEHEITEFLKRVCVEVFLGGIQDFL